MTLDPGLILGDVWPGIAAGAAAAAILPWLRRESEPARAAIMAVAIALTLYYVVWRGLATLPPPGLTLDFITGLTFYVVEAVTLIGAALNFFFLIRVSDRTPVVERNLSWLHAQDPLPLVDVLDLHLQRRARHPRAHHHRRPGHDLSGLPPVGVR